MGRTIFLFTMTWTAFWVINHRRGETVYVVDGEGSQACRDKLLSTLGK